MLDAAEVRSWAQYRMWKQEPGYRVAVWKSPGYFLRHLSLLLARLLLYRNVCDQESDGLSLPPAPGTRRVH